MRARDWLPLSIPSINPAAQLPRAELGLAGQRLRQSPVSKTGSASPARRLGSAGGSRGERSDRHGKTAGSNPRGGCEGLDGRGCPHPKWGGGGFLPARNSVPLWGRERLGNRGAELWQMKNPQTLPFLPPPACRGGEGGFAGSAG